MRTPVELHPDGVAVGGAGVLAGSSVGVGVGVSSGGDVGVAVGSDG